MNLHLPIRSVWDGAPLDPSQWAEARVVLSPSHAEFLVEAPYHRDPPPPMPPGLMDGLWAYEVVEVFLCGPGDRYLEVEFSPHGHHLGLALDGFRGAVSRRLVELEYEARVEGDRWQGRASLEGWRGLLGGEVERVNAFAIRGTGAARCYMAAWPTGGPKPDFHRLETFAGVEEVLGE